LNTKPVSSMKAMVYQRYGEPDVVHLQELEKPVPDDHEVLIKIHATSVTAGDCRMRSFTVPQWQWLPARLYLGVFRPRRKILGMELAGVIEAIGKNVTRFKVGDAVFASTFEVNFGAHAEYKSMPEDGLIVLKPGSMSFAEAAVVPSGGITAYHLIQKANIQSGQQVLIYGASGSVGTFAIQLAKYYGATVTAVCSTSNLNMVKSIGADHVIDYTREDLMQLTVRYDIVIEAVGKLSAAQAKKILKPQGQFVDVISLSAKLATQDLLFLKTLIEEGKIKSVIDRCYPLEEIVQAYHHVDKGHKQGNVVINVTA
jgi:NADPH:quinone reductase-like Zn-dependent oxidoreductase